MDLFKKKNKKESEKLDDEFKKADRQEKELRCLKFAIENQDKTIKENICLRQRYNCKQPDDNSKRKIRIKDKKRKSVRRNNKIRSI